MDSTGAVVCPSTFVVNFTHSSGNREMETILSNDEAAQFTVGNIFGEWAPDQIAAQDTVNDAILDGCTGTLYILGYSDAYLLECEGAQPILVTGNGTWAEDTGYIWDDITKITVRAANGRGGFGPAKVARYEAALNNVDEDVKVLKLIENGQVVILRDGVKYNTLGTVIR